MRLIAYQTDEKQTTTRAQHRGRPDNT